MNEKARPANENPPEEELRAMLRKYVDGRVLTDGTARELYGKLTDLLEADLVKIDKGAGGHVP